MLRNPRPRWREIRNHRLRQPQDGGDQPGPLRSGDQPYLSGHGPPLRDERGSGPAVQASRQGKVEQSMLLVERRVLARLRNQRFFSLLSSTWRSASWSPSQRPRHARLRRQPGRTPPRQSLYRRLRIPHLPLGDDFPPLSSSSSPGPPNAWSSRRLQTPWRSRSGRNGMSQPRSRPSGDATPCYDAVRLD